MKIFRLAFISITVLGLLISCSQNTKKEIEQNKTQNRIEYVSIDGLWKCTSETALELEDLTLEPVINISGEMSNKLSVKGCFTWGGQFRDYWWLSEIEYCDSLNQIKIQDVDGSTYIGIIDETKQKITGMMYSKDGNKLIPEDKLDFIRASNFNTDRLFTPRKLKPDGSIQYSYQIPKKLNDGLETESIFKYSNDTTALYQLMKDVIYQEYGRLESFIIIKNNKLVLEEYFYNYNQNDLHNIFSCTKSIVSLSAGLAFDQNQISNMKQSVFEAFPKYESLKNEKNKSISLQHILTMTPGFEGNEKYKHEHPEKIVENILSLPLDSEPGEQFRYNSESPYFLGGIIYDLSGKTISEFTKEHVFNPLGITTYDWKEENGNPHCESDLYMLPRDMAKIGLMTVNNGKWLDKQIIPENWIKESTKFQVAESDFLNYGYQWWHRSKENKAWWKEQTEESKEHDLFMALGYGGQYIFVIKDLDLVITMTSSDYNEGNGMAFKKIPMVIEEIVPLFE